MFGTGEHWSYVCGQLQLLTNINVVGKIVSFQKCQNLNYFLCSNFLSPWRFWSPWRFHISFWGPLLESVIRSSHIRVKSPFLGIIFLRPGNLTLFFCDVTMMLLRSQSSGPEIQRPQVRILREFNFSNVYFLQPLFWRLYVVAVLVTLQPDSTLKVKKPDFVKNWTKDLFS